MEENTPQEKSVTELHPNYCRILRVKPHIQRPSVRMQLYKKFRLEGLSGYKAAIKAGYSHATALNAHRNIEKRIKFDDMLVKAGLDNDTIMRVLGEGLVATKVISAMVIVKPNTDGTPNLDIKELPADSKTTDFIDVPDYNVRHRYLETLLKLKGELREIVESKSEKLVIIREIIKEKDNGDQSQGGRLSGLISIIKE